MAYRGASINIPTFTKGKSQRTSADVESTRRLANVRIHVECGTGSEVPDTECNNAITNSIHKIKRWRSHAP